MRLTKKKSIELSIELWTFLAETGREKEDWPRWSEVVPYEEDYLYFYEDREIGAGCFLCEYGVKKMKRGSVKDQCDVCPYDEVFGDCCEDETPFTLWHDSEDIEERKKYALQFLGQLKQLVKK